MSEYCSLHTHTHTANQNNPDVTLQSATHSALQPPGHGSPLSDTLNVLHKPPNHEAQNALGASPLSASVLRFSMRVRWTFHDACWAQADIQSPMQIGTSPMNEQKERISRKIDGWLLLSNHKWSFLVHNRVLTCAANRPAADVLNSTNTCGRPSIHHRCISESQEQSLSNLPRKCLLAR